LNLFAGDATNAEAPVNHEFAGTVSFTAKMGNELTVGALFAGIEGFGLGFEQAGFRVLWQVEQEKFCKRVLRRHWPKVKRYTAVAYMKAMQEYTRH
jgi:hypothetical protein